MIQEPIDQKLLERQEERSKRLRSNLWSPSSFGRCYRYQYWNRLNEPQTNPPDSRVLRVFKAGELFHDFVQQFFNDAQVEVKAEKDDIKGYADIVLNDAVVDIKSVHSYQFHYTKKRDYDVTKEKYANIIQLMTYAWILNKPKGILIFVSKDDLCLDEYTFLTEDWIGEIEKELSTLRSYWDKKELPPCEPKAYGGKEGKYCPYKDKCGDDCGHK